MISNPLIANSRPEYLLVLYFTEAISFNTKLVSARLGTYFIPDIFWSKKQVLVSFSEFLRLNKS